MGTITEAQISQAIASTLGTTTGMTYTQHDGTLTDHIADTPLLQVTWRRNEIDYTSTSGMTSFRGGIRQWSMLFWGDLYVARLAHLAENKSAMLTLVNALNATIESQSTKPYFGNSGIKSFDWSVESATFEVGDPLARYVGARFIFNIKVF